MPYNFDPEVAPAIELFDNRTFDDPVASRAAMNDMFATINADIDVSSLNIREHSIAGLDDDPDLVVRVYQPNDKASLTPALLHMHGGGFAVGSLDTEHAFSVAITEALGIALVSVDYRLAPENPYPAGLNDCYAALCWLHDNATSLGVDPARIGIYGQSAGGGLAAALALMARDQGGPAICFQFLGMPELDDRLETTSMKNFTDTPAWSRPSAEYSWDYYLGDNYRRGAANVPIYAAPARASDLAGLPPAYITAMEFDPLRDEDVIYGLRLLEAGVSVELHTFPGTFHGSVMVPSAAITQRQLAEGLVVLRKGLRVDE